MSCGLPVLSTKCGGPESIITNDDLGVLTDFDKLAKNMYYFSTKKYNSNHIRQYVNNHFSESVIAKQLCKIYEMGS